MTRETIDAQIIDNINANTDLPFFGEGAERKGISWGYGKISPYLSDKQAEMLLTVSDGVTDEEAVKIQIDLTRDINKAIDVPLIGEPIEAMAIGASVAWVVSKLRNGVSVIAP